LLRRLQLARKALPGTMKIAYTSSRETGATDSLLASLAEILIGQGVRIRGAVQINREGRNNGPCDMDVKVLPDGPVIRISQSRGKEARGCRLDPGALEAVVGLVETSLADGADLLIVSKFGKHEAEGRGFRALIAEALACEIPVLVGLNRLNAPAFKDYTGGLAIELTPRFEALLEWLDAGAVAPECMVLDRRRDDLVRAL
jgi:nucleoside-triphosphatase THEP1